MNTRRIQIFLELKMQELAPFLKNVFQTLLIVAIVLIVGVGMIVAGLPYILANVMTLCSPVIDWAVNISLGASGTTYSSSYWNILMDVGMLLEVCLFLVLAGVTILVKLALWLLDNWIEAGIIYDRECQQRYIKK